MKLFIVLLFLFVNVHNIFGKKSFTIVVDNSQSMKTEIDILKFNLKSIFNFRNIQKIDKYILILVNDKHVSAPLIYPTIEDLVAYLSKSGITDSLSQDCSKNSIPGIERALEQASFDGNIFVFTDGPPKTGINTDRIKNLCSSKRAQVQIFLSGSCGESGTDSERDLEILKNIAIDCSGNLLRLNPTDLQKAFNFMGLLITKEWDEITHDTVTDYTEYTIKSEAYVTNMLLCITFYGNYPRISYDENYPILKLTETTYVTVMHVTTSQEAQFKINVGCQGSTIVTTYMKINLPLVITFAPRRPLSFLETAIRPIPGHLNFIAIKITGNIKLDTFVLDIEGINKTLKLDYDEMSNLFIASNIFEPYKAFRMTVSGYDVNSFKIIPSTVIGLWKPQEILPEKLIIWRPINIKIIPPQNSTILYGSNITLVCKVEGYPKPDITWQDTNGMELPSEQYVLYISSHYLSYLEINNFTEQKSFYCIAINGREKHIASIDLNTYRPYSLNIIQNLQDTTIQYLTKGKLDYAISAYPDAEIQWYHNGSQIDSINSDVYEVTDDALIIKNMTLDTVGSYECVVKHPVGHETMQAEVTISGLDVPEVDLEEKVIVKPGDWKEIECSVTKGFPIPSITWTFKATGSEDFSYLPDVTETYANNNKLKFGIVQKKHAGIYKCTAENFIGAASKEMKLEVQYEPSIERDVEKETVNEGDTVELHCKVDAVPAARVEWMKNGLQLNIIDQDIYRVTEDNTLLIQARENTSGIYSCLAENELGSDNKTVVVDVLVGPYVNILPNQKILVKRVGETLNLQCEIKKGNPIPSIMWNFIGTKPNHNKSFQTIQTNPVYINRITKDNEGRYQCIAKNKLKTDRVEIEVQVV